MTSSRWRESPFDGSALRFGLFGSVVASQLAHLIEHILIQLTGSAVLGAAADSEEVHLVFNGLVAAFALALVLAFRQNPWVYPLALLSVFHGIEHVYIYSEFVRTGVNNGPGLLGLGGAVELIPLGRLDLHNFYNGVEMILMALGLWHEVDSRIASEEENAL